MGGGGGYGGPVNIGELKKLVERAKKELRDGAKDSKQNVFISFPYESIDEVNLLRAQAKNEKSPLEFNDWSVSEPFNSKRASYLKQKISERIQHSSATVVYLSPHTASSNWVKWEVEESVRRGKNIIAVYKGDVAPKSLPKFITDNNIERVRWKDLAIAISKRIKTK